MKKLFIGLVSVVFTAGIFVVPAMAKSVFNVAIIPCGAAVPLGSAGADCAFNHNVAKTAMIWLNASTATIWLKNRSQVRLAGTSRTTTG